VAILDINGRVVIGDALYILRRNVREALNNGYKQLVFNMEGVSYIDSAGIGELVSCFTTVTTQGGNLKLIKTTEKVKDLLHMTKLLTIFESFLTEEEALASFAAPPDPTRE
jgi:anti-sigma B factor antagonist